jgi:hypothetical protein
MTLAISYNGQMTWPVFKIDIWHLYLVTADRWQFLTVTWDIILSDILVRVNIILPDLGTVPSSDYYRRTLMTRMLMCLIHLYSQGVRIRLLTLLHMQFMILWLLLYLGLMLRHSPVEVEMVSFYFWDSNVKSIIMFMQCNSVSKMITRKHYFTVFVLKEHILYVTYSSNDMTPSILTANASTK